ncbi:MAG: T9SS type A sorting domain-containing protein, partial [Chitinophagaceae bacterium]
DSPGFGVFPNPSTGRITIETPLAGELTIWNSAGQEILRKILNADRNEIEIQLNGVYMLMFKDYGGNITSKKVKIRK